MHQHPAVWLVKLPTLCVMYIGCDKAYYFYWLPGLHVSILEQEMNLQIAEEREREATRSAHLIEEKH